jgi:predicted ATPase
VRRLVEVLADGPPLVLLLEDLHWADSSPVELLCALLRRPPAGPVLLATALR